MIFVTGDCHSDFRRLNSNNFEDQKDMDKSDYVIICGDFGGIFSCNVDDATEKYNLDWLEKKPFTTLFVDGNHENFDRLNHYKVEMWNGGKVHFIRPSVIHLMRGQVFNLDGNNIFCFGGASSHDISGGLLDPKDPYFTQKKHELYKGELPFRIMGETWWKEEMPSKEEMKEGINNLRKYNNKVDYVITHCSSTSIQTMIGKKYLYRPDELTDYLETIKENTKYLKWFFGHYHDNRMVTYEDIMLYEQIIRIS